MEFLLEKIKVAEPVVEIQRRDTQNDENTFETLQKVIRAIFPTQCIKDPNFDLYGFSLDDRQLRMSFVYGLLFLFSKSWAVENQEKYLITADEFKQRINMLYDDMLSGDCKEVQALLQEIKTKAEQP